MNEPAPDADALHILVVDDSAFARKSTIAALNSSALGGARVSEAPHGAAALEMLRNDPADLVLSDINMPELDGVQMLSRIRVDPRLNDIKVVLISSVVGRGVEDSLREAGADAVIAKPFTSAHANAVLPDLVGDMKKEYR